MESKKSGGKKRMHLHCWPFLVATAVCWSNTDGIAQCGMSRATTESTGCCHWATTCSVLLQRPPAQQANKQQSTNKPTLLAILMAAAMRWYVTARIAWWRRSRALIEATGCHQWASIAANRCNWSCKCRFFTSFLSSTRIKRSRVESKAPIFNRGITYQMKEKGLTKVSILFVREVIV